MNIEIAHLPRRQWYTGGGLLRRLVCRQTGNCDHPKHDEGLQTGEGHTRKDTVRPDTRQ